MGSKRVGLARTQALIEGLKRDINLSTTSLLNGLLRKKGEEGKQADTTFIIGRNAVGADGNTADPYSVSTTKLFPLGTRLIYNDREYRYAKAGATIAAGEAVCTRNKVGSSHHNNMNVLAAPIGATQVTVVTNGTNLVKDEYADGYLYVNDGTGQGLAYKVKSHPAHVHGTSPNCVITLFDPIKVALVASGTSQVTLAHNKYEKIIKAPGTTPLTGEAVGVASSVLADGDFFWIQVKGPAACLVSGTVVIGDSVGLTISGGTAGALAPIVADSAAQRVSRVVGQVMEVNASTEFALIDLMFE